MAVVRCSSGHYYDDEKFSRCPHCGIFKNAGDQEELVRETPVKKKRFFFGASSSRRGNGVQKEGSLESDDDVTQAFDESGAGSDSGDSEDDLKTIGRFSAEKGNDYVTGWLVCVIGEKKGTDYRLHHGFNWIVGEAKMDPLNDLASAGKKNHCAIVYDDKANDFTAVPGNGTLTYVDGKLLEKPIKIETGDRLQIGECSYEFVAFCRKGRVWEDE